MVILTDLSEVLINGLSGIDEVIKRKHGEFISHEAMKRFGLTGEVFENLLRGEITEDDYWRIFLKEGRWPFSAEEAKKMLSDNISKKIPFTRCVYESIICYPEHTGRGHKILDGCPEIYIVSDYISERINEVKKLHPSIFSMTAGQFWSCELGMIKPDEQFFDNLLEIMHVETSEVIFVDDKATNIKAARYAGINSIHFKNAFQLAEELSLYGFEFSKNFETIKDDKRP